MSDKHLWEYDHPYHCTEGNFFKNGYHLEFDSWAEFVAEGGLYDSDPDMNLLFRWDWHPWHLEYHEGRALLAHLLGNEGQEAHHLRAAERCHKRQDRWQRRLHRGGVA